MTLRTLLLAAALTPLTLAPVWAQNTQVLSKQYDDGGVYEGTF